MLLKGTYTLGVRVVVLCRLMALHYVRRVRPQHSLALKIAGGDLLEAEELEHLVGDLPRAKAGPMFPLGKKSQVTRPGT